MATHQQLFRALFVKVFKGVLTVKGGCLSDVCPLSPLLQNDLPPPYYSVVLHTQPPLQLYTLEPDRYRVFKADMPIYIGRYIDFIHAA
jgi:hypothetical protein